jgi:hypothetical protein
MWVIFRDPKTPFTYLDKYVVDLVEDKDILAYQEGVLAVHGGRMFDLNLQACFSQQMVRTADDVSYFARKYTVWIHTGQAPRMLEG